MGLGILLLLSIAAVVQGQMPLQEMVKTEQAFSKMAEEKTAREAFMAFIADDGLLFRPGAVNGKQWMLEHPVPPSDKKPLLAWQPNFAEMSVTDTEKENKVIERGNYVRIWKRQGANWQVVLDITNAH